MTRKEYLLKQKEEGRHLLGVFPAQYPREILWAMNIVPAEIWDPALDTTASDSRLQPYICSVVRLGLELILQGKCDFLDGFLFPHTCDSLQNLASIIHEYLPEKKPCYCFYHPRAPYGPAAREFYGNQLKDMVESLEWQFGLFNEAAFIKRVRQGQQISWLLQELYKLQAKGQLDVSNREFYRVVRLGEYLFPDDLIVELETFLARNRRQEKKARTPVVLSGVLPNPPELLTLLDDIEVRVASDDFLNGSRRLLVPQKDLVDPFELLLECYFDMPPCSTRGSSISERSRYLLRLVDRTGAKGVIFNMTKFCEPEWFDVPHLKEELRKRGIPTLILDTELNKGLSGQMATRVEAFIEIVRAHRERPGEEE
ncbi:MAG: 2-hydroxyacyl-CoA dehydratase [Deltaproteobacteria bacterium]|nr:2-hydroxyacyl-CoA dehydratase [Deltaproteobacteria bacterium]